LFFLPNWVWQLEMISITEKPLLAIPFLMYCSQRTGWAIVALAT
jgi:hypothetical protein